MAMGWDRERGTGGGQDEGGTRYPLPPFLENLGALASLLLLGLLLEKEEKITYKRMEAGGEGYNGQ